jgi:mono/diheme cytochrome c family protein
MTPLPQATELPAAWLGMNPAFKEPTVTICAWCADKEAAEALAIARGLHMTHGQCPSCHAAEMARLRERFAAPAV